MAIYNNDAVWLRPLGAAKEKTLSSIGKLSGGIGLQSAADDPAGMAVSINLDAELRSLHQAGSNTVQALSMLRTAEGGLSSITESLIRIRELGVMAGSSTYSDSQREMIQAEIASLQEGIDNVAASTEYNGTPLLDGSAGELVFQVGTGPTASSQIEYETRDLSAAALGIAGASVLSVPDAQALIDTVDQALSDVGQYQADVGSKMNRVESAGRGIEHRYGDPCGGTPDVYLNRRDRRHVAQPGLNSSKRYPGCLTGPGRLCVERNPAAVRRQ